MANIHALFTLGLQDVRYNIGTEAAPCFLSCNPKGGEDQQLAAYLKCEPGARATGKALYKLYTKDPTHEAKRLRLPIIAPCLEYLKTLKRDTPLGTIVFVVTDQPVSEPKHSSDTVNFGPLVEALLKAIYLQERSVVFSTITVGKNPHLDSSAYRQIGQALTRVLPDRRGDRFFTFVSPGIPAISQAIKQHSLRVYGPDWVPCQVEEPDAEALKSGACSLVTGVKLIERDNPFLEDALIATIRTLIGKYDYSAALKTWQTSMLQTSALDSTVQGLLRHAVARLNHDFDEAFRLGRNVEPDLDPTKRTLEIKLRELYDAASIAVGQGQLGTLVSKVATFYENAFRVLAVRLTGDSAWLEKEVPSGIVFAAVGSPKSKKGTRRLDRAIIRAVLENASLLSSKMDLQRVKGYLNALDPVYELRNDSLHHIDPISAAIIKRETNLKPENILEQCKIILTTFGIGPTRKNAYDSVNDRLNEVLRYTFER